MGTACLEVATIRPQLLAPARLNHLEGCGTSLRERARLKLLKPTSLNTPSLRSEGPNIAPNQGQSSCSGVPYIVKTRTQQCKSLMLNQDSTPRGFSDSLPLVSDLLNFPPNLHIFCMSARGPSSSLLSPLPGWWNTPPQWRWGRNAVAPQRSESPASGSLLWLGETSAEPLQLDIARPSLAKCSWGQSEIPANLGFPTQHRAWTSRKAGAFGTWLKQIKQGLISLIQLQTSTLALSEVQTCKLGMSR